MMYFLALLPATMLTVAGYAVLYLAHRSEGALKSFGRYLGFWAFTLAGLIVLGAIFAAARGLNMHAMMMQSYPSHEAMRPCPYLHSARHPAPASGDQVGPGAPAPPRAASPETTPPN